MTAEPLSEPLAEPGPRDGAAWIVLTPSADDLAWRHAIAAAAADAGLTLVQADLPHPPEARDDPRVVMLTADGQAARLANPARGAALAPRPETAADAAAAHYGLPAPQNAWHASALLARALSLPPHLRVVAQPELAEASGPIELFSGFRVAPPPPRGVSPALSPALARAFDLYRRPAIPTGEVLDWPPELFVVNGKSLPPEEAAAEFDMTGRARALVYGPFLSLPPGRWRARMRFSIDEPAMKAILRFDWGSGDDFASHDVKLDRAGLFEIVMDHGWDIAEAIQFRIQLMQPLFDGRMTFAGGTVERLGLGDDAIVRR